MLSLSTHEPHFFIIREALNNSFKQRNNSIKQELEKARNVDTRKGRFTVEFNFIEMIYVRDYLENYYEDARRECDFKWNIENLIDDFVFLCFFGGNDFLPHLPALNIHQGGIDILMHLYKRMLPVMGGYITKNGNVDLSKIEIFMKEFAKSEESVLKQIEQNQKDLVIEY